MNTSIVTFAERPGLLDQVRAVSGPSWPEFMFHSPVSDRLWVRLEGEFPDFQFVVIGSEGALLALGNSIPFSWDGNPDSLDDGGWEWAFEKGIADHDRGIPPNALCALQIAIPPQHRGQGLSHDALNGMRGIALRHGFGALVAPVRPNHKPLYPLTPIDRYLRWTRDDGAPFDPWLRVHWRAGARIVRACPRSMTIEGTVAEWESWAGMPFPETGVYVVTGALEPVAIDREADVGRYVEPNVWMVHDLT